MYLNNNVPEIDGLKIYILMSKLFQDRTGGVVPCTWLVVKTIQGCVPVFESYLQQGYSCLYDKAAIDCFVHDENYDPAKLLPLSDLQYWDCPSYFASIITKKLVGGASVIVNLKSGKKIKGEYLFTIDFAAPDPNLINTDYSEYTPEHKSMNVIALENGQFAIYPNNRLLFLIPSLGSSAETIMAFDRSRIKTQPHIPSVEGEYIGLDLSKDERYYYT